ncbi:MAG TPA: ABC transporter ATP-binding protein [Gemmatimonadales bacterium]|nr:ABC transporter ATP-binding protein [Gemmatimonadales bacterium]
MSFTVQPGEIIALLGANGSGKSTLLRLLATAARPSSGELSLFGQDPRARADTIRARIGVLGHASGLYGELTARENLHFAATMYGTTLSPEACEARLNAVGLAHAAGARVRTYSQGMVQRLSLLRSTLHDPELLLLDEPYTALDVNGLGIVDRVLTDVRAAGKSALMATHLVERSLRLCDRAIVLADGAIAYDGSVANVPSSVLPSEMEGVA